MKKTILIISAIAAAVSVSSCRSYLDINTDPNAPDPDNVSTDMILPGAEASLAQCYGDYMRITGGYFSEQYSQMFGTSNYLDYSQFEMSATRSSSNYGSLYEKALVNLKSVKEKAAASEDWTTYLAATTYMSFIYQALVDCYGETPYTEALDATNLAPKYDEGKTVYEGIVKDIDEALAKNPTGYSATSLLFPSGNASSWIAFANTVKLKVLMRMSSTVDVKSQLDALIKEDNFIQSDAAFSGCWTNAQYAANPFYSEEFSSWHSQSNVVANVALVRTMTEYDADGNAVYTDPRLPLFFEKNSGGIYLGGISGTNFDAKAPAPYNSDSGLSRPAVKAETPVMLISLFDVEFFKAEYYARYGSEADAAAHYAKAVEASFASAGAEGAADNIQRHPFSKEEWAKCIGIAKWVALSGCNNFEAWCEVRRLKYPAFGTVKGSDMWNGNGDKSVNVTKYEWGTLYTPYQVFGEIGNDKLLQRWPYANLSQSRNTNCPEFKGYTTPVFWAE